MELLDYEKKHIQFLEENAAECCLFLKKNNEFPLTKTCDIVLLGDGARNTIKGGTGSGDVASRFFKTIEQAMISNGFNITSSSWMDEYDLFRESTKKDFIKQVKKDSKKVNIMPAVYSIGLFEEEKEYTLTCDYEGDACIYVLARNSGEGNDKKNIKGDIKLTDKEISDILYLNKKFKKFMLVLNVGGVIDISPVLEVSNILLLSQLGVVTGDVFVNILLGKSNPSGKLAATWAKPEDYPFFNEFGDRDDTYYKEGIYVGYRYFNTVRKNIVFPFGYGLSYTDFDIKVCDTSLNDSILTIECIVKNKGNYPGKEVVQAYVTKPNTIMDNPYIELCDYKKTSQLNPLEEEKIVLTIDFKKLGNYDESRALNVLQSGNYIVRVGNSSLNIRPVAKCILKEEIVLEKLQNKCGDKSLVDLKLDRDNEELNDICEYELTFKCDSKEVIYKKDTYVDSLIETLSNENLAYTCLGHHLKGFAAIVGSSCEHVVGGAGETVLRVPEIKYSLTMADGPAGLRLKQKYGVDKKGVYDIVLDPLMEKMLDYLPKMSACFIKPPKNRKGKVYCQYTTAIPIGTALAQSFNDDLVYLCGRLVTEEMDIFKVDLWLAPALNIQRNILCGRNFEYYSEDPYLSGRVAVNMIKGIEKDTNLGVTIKHFAANNQEFNRNNNNSHISERALREIYLKGFEMCVKESNPKALMTSYNLINGVHASESYELMNDIVRCEWEYDGLIMTDWIASGRTFCKSSRYPAPYASNNILAGNDLTMSGSPADFKDLMKALKENKIRRNDLIYSASRIYRSILRQKDIK